VLKADGLAGGKGVLIIEEKETAKAELENMFSGKFGAAGETVVIEEFLDGIELSVFALSDGENYVMLPEAKDYKRIGEGDQGLNTGGMGAVSPVPFANREFLEKVEKRIVKPTIEGLRKEGIPYCGFLFVGLMNVNGDPYVIEYNVRMGDPETEVVLPRIKSDLLPFLTKAARGQLKGESLAFETETAVTVMTVSGGYPESYEKGKVMDIRLENTEDLLAIHAGTKSEGEAILTSGGRVLSVTAMANTLPEAIKKAYQGVSRLSFDKMYFRRDIGKDLL
jgi:phosphoribosylamine--glycine ligase